MDVMNLDSKVRQRAEAFLGRLALNAAALRPTSLLEYFPFTAQRVAAVLDRCESPIEQLFALAVLLHSDANWWSVIEPMWSDDYFGRTGSFASAYSAADPGTDVRVIVACQQEAGPFRVDFALTGERAAGDVVWRIGVELDGHDFHERTKEQARRDKSRDRALAVAGWRVLRFTGSEVWRDTDACVREVFAVATTLSPTEAK